MRAHFPAGVVLALLASPAFPQLFLQQTVTATGSATVAATPNQAMIYIGVVTQARTAQDATSQNASLVQAVLAALSPIVGTNGTIQTVSYSVSPNYNYPQNGSPVLTGFTVTNTVMVTTNDLTSIGKIIDAATAAGANSIQSLQFGLQNQQPVVAQALQQAAMSAQSQAGAIATGLGLHTTRVISAQEGSSVQPIVTQVAGTANTSTTIQPGTLQIQASVTVVMEVSQ
jgi:uncharacterized protein YggE